jgi:iron complex transport system permease protein
VTSDLALPGASAGHPLSGGAPRSTRALPAKAIALLVVVAFVAFLLSVSVGSVGVVVPWAALDPEHTSYAVAAARFERTVTGCCVGAALALSGALLQGLTRNPLADPGLLGITAGATIGMVLAVGVWSVEALSGYLWFSFLGAALAAIVVHLLAGLGGGAATPGRIVIAGAAVTAALTSWTTALLLTDHERFDRLRFWMVGGLGTGYDALQAVGPTMLVGVVLGLLGVRLLDTLALGDDLARSLGRNVFRDRLVVGLAVVLLAGSATAAAGPISFVGLIVPHAVRAMVGPSHGRVLPLSLGWGAVLVIVADTVGRVIAPPTEVQVGIMTALVGVPVFFLLVRRGAGVRA